MPETMEEKINKIVDALIVRRNNPNEMASAIQNLSKALGFAIALSSKGDPKMIDQLFIGAEEYTHREAVNNAALGALANLEGKPNG